MSLYLFRIVDFHPTITEDLRNKALDFAEKFININIWQKKGNLFDVTMGSLDSVEKLFYSLYGAGI